MSILVTGGSGYLGSYLINYLEKRGIKCVNYDIINGNDIRDYDNLVSFMKNINIVIHLAALSSVSACNDNPSLAIDINQRGTQVLLQAMKQCNVTRIIYASTSSIYGNSNSCNELDTPSPCSSYGNSKLLGEQEIINSDMDYLIFRMFNVVGKNTSMKSSGHDRLFSALNNRLVTIYGTDYNTRDGTAERDYISLEDVCEAYYLGILTNNRREIINICSGEAISVLYIVGVWKRLALLEYKYGPRRKGDPDRVTGNNNKAKTLLNWNPNKKIDDIILDYLQ